MTALAWLIPVALLLGGCGLAAFLWSLRTGQYDDLEGAGWRALDDGEPIPTGGDVANDVASKCRVAKTQVAKA